MMKTETNTVMGAVTMRIMRFACLVCILAMISSFLVGCGNAEKSADPTKGKQQQAEKGNLKEKLPPQAKKSLPQKVKVNEASANKQGDMIRIAEGVGATETEALKDAWRKAIWQTVGVYVDAETIIKNDEIISDKVLNYSNGVITKYEEIAKANDGALVRITIKAQVEPRPLVALLKHNNIAVRNIDGKSIYANIMTRKEAAKDARLLMEKVLNGYPWNLYQARVRSRNIQESRNAAKLNLQLEIKINPKEYGRFVANLKNTLRVIATQTKKGLVINPVRTSTKGKPEWLLRSQGDPSGVFGHEWLSGRLRLWINSHLNESKTRFEWESFVIDESTIPTVTQCADRKYKFKFVLGSRSNKLVTPTYYFDAGFPSIVGGVFPPLPRNYAPRSYKNRNILVAPVFFTRIRGPSYLWYLSYQAHHIRNVAIPLTLNELKQLDHIEVSLVPN